MNVQFETAIRVQTYHFDFIAKDGTWLATAVAESGDEKREVRFSDVNKGACSL